MILGIFSDTHDNKQNIEKARKIFADHKVELCLFTGDLVSPFALKFLSEWPFPIKAIFGNNEGDKWGIKRRFKTFNITNIEYAPKSGLFWQIQHEDGNIALFHGHISEFTDLLVSSNKYQLVCTGHTHIPHIKVLGSTTWINPGSVTGFSTDDPSITVGSVAVFDTKTKEATIIPLD